MPERLGIPAVRSVALECAPGAALPVALAISTAPFTTQITDVKLSGLSTDVTAAGPISSPFNAVSDGTTFTP